ECLLDVRRRAITGRGGAGAGVWLSADGVLRIRSKFRDLGIRVARLVDGGANVVDMRRMLERHLHQRTASELDAVVDAVVSKEAKPNDDPRDGEDRRLLPVPDEVVLRVVKNAKHWQSLRCSASGRRVSAAARSCRRCGRRRSR